MPDLDFRFHYITQTGGADARTEMELKTSTVHRYLAGNGMRVLLVPMEATTFWVGMYVNAGSRHERGKRGVAHFLEHMMFKGTRDLPGKQLILKLDDMGAMYNAHTTHEHTHYYFAGDPSHAPELLELLLHIFLQPAYPDEEISKERNVVMEELNVSQDDPDTLMSEHTLQTIYKDLDPSLAHSILGSEEEIRSFTRADILEFVRLYTPENSVLVMSGSMDQVAMVAHTSRVLGCRLTKTGIPDYSPMIERLLRIKYYSEERTPKLIHVPLEDRHQVKVSFNYLTVGLYSRLDRALNVLTNVLSGGMTSMLFDLLRNRLGVTYHSNSKVYKWTDTGMFIVELSVENKSALLTIRELLLMLKRLCAQGITAEMLARAKKQISTALLFSMNTEGDYIDFFGYRELMQLPYTTLKQIRADVKAVQLEDVNRLCSVLFRRNNLFMSVAGNIQAPQVQAMLDDHGLFHME